MKLETKKDEYLSKIIHDLKMPANAQVRALETFIKASESKINEKEKDLIDLTLRSCRYMQELIETFGAVHKLKYEKIKLNYEKFDTCELIQEITDKLKILFKLNNLTLELNLSNKSDLYADKTQFKMVIENILDFCIKNSFNNSKIVINTYFKNNNFNFELINNSAYLEPKITNEFFENKKNYASTCANSCASLGLYLSREIINAHFGSIYIRSYENNTNILGFNIPTK